MQLLGGNFLCFPRTFALGDHSGGNHIGRYFLPHQETSPGGRLGREFLVPLPSLTKGQTTSSYYLPVSFSQWMGRRIPTCLLSTLFTLRMRRRYAKQMVGPCFASALTGLHEGGWDVCRKRKDSTTTFFFCMN